MADLDVVNPCFSNAFAGEEMTAVAFPGMTCRVCRFWTEQGGGWGYCLAQRIADGSTGEWEHPVQHGGASACPKFQRDVVWDAL